MQANDDYAIAGTDIGKYKKYQARVGAGGTGPLVPNKILKRICEKILAQFPGG
jgi:hypothetical protein